MTAAIKSVDPNHLVSLGTAGGGKCGLSTTDYQNVNAGAINICDYYDYRDVTQAMLNDGYNPLAQRIAQCGILNQLIVVTESGIAADVDTNGQDTGTITATTLQNRANFHAKLNAAFSAGIAGYVLWEKEQDASNSTENITGHSLFEVVPNCLLYDPTNI